LSKLFINLLTPQPYFLVLATSLGFPNWKELQPLK